MKTPIFAFAFLFFASFSFAQTNQGANIWLGNTYGPAQDWHHPGNWSKGHVPTELEEVVIPDLSNKGSAQYPVIRYDVEVRLVNVHPAASIRIVQGANLQVNDAFQDPEIHYGKVDPRVIINKGEKYPSREYKHRGVSSVSFVRN